MAFLNLFYNSFPCQVNKSAAFVHEPCELLGGEGLLAVASGVGRVVVYLDEQAVGAAATAARASGSTIQLMPEEWRGPQ
jgi:hypothetical protein